MGEGPKGELTWYRFNKINFLIEDLIMIDLFWLESTKKFRLYRLTKPYS